MQVTTDQALKRTAAVAGGGGAIAAASWFWPMRGTQAFTGESSQGFLVHVLILCVVAAGCGALFGYLSGAFTLRFGIGRITVALGIFGVLQSLYSSHQRSGHVSPGTWLDGMYWAVVCMAFVGGTGGLVRWFAARE
jgi:ribose/xylose/arabinose/galactoside ABC-type transport system permease subunit